jgi:hypothetical protein
MPECIVCKEHYEPDGGQGDVCSRCGSDNQEWQEVLDNPVEKEGFFGLLKFMEPHFHLPLLVAAFATIFGMMFAFTLWRNIKPGFRALAVLVTPIGCLLSLQGIYEARRQIRVNEFARQVKRGWSKGLGAQTVTLLLPAVAMTGVLVLTLSLIQVDILWEMVKWFALIDAPDAGDSLPQKMLAVTPFSTLVSYVALAISFTASSSLMLARRYINQLNEKIPPPIFLQPRRLARVVRREAEDQLGRVEPEQSNLNMMGCAHVEDYVNLQNLRLPASVDMGRSIDGPVSPQATVWVQAANWVWDEMERDDDGGVRMKVAREEIYHLSKPASQRPPSRVRYVVHADLWGRVTEIKRDI